MKSAELRNKLHQYIDSADEHKLQAIYTVLETEIEQEATYNAEIIEMLHERRQNHLDGKSKSLNAEDSINMIRQKRK
jgi:hypothetical protein